MGDLLVLQFIISHWTVFLSRFLVSSEVGKSRVRNLLCQVMGNGKARIDLWPMTTDIWALAGVQRGFAYSTDPNWWESCLWGFCNYLIHSISFFSSSKQVLSLKELVFCLFALLHVFVFKVELKNFFLFFFNFRKRKRKGKKEKKNPWDTSISCLIHAP